ncbi:HAD-IA family hydrolase [Streptomyces rubradiris]|uniref:Tyrosine-protein kinase PtkA n=1 Tax=Streptomyces rubradiris TaxID=285531 RepID=Q2PC74_STRRR|nr:HAD-IA family hydrolase [Streptomyces rubradiris]GHH30946.1 phosphoglycolate phosphatase [Streptomyces rubradiris]GHI52674.1 phosphoglycolate phosphatase [Streptomyces rubradiris]CAI94691.1 putative phosphatase [Streptomyces rubradiris]
MASVPVRSVVIFDLDGVLVDSHEVMGRAFAAAYAEVVGAGPAPFAEYQRHQGLYFPDIMRRMRLPLEMEEPFVRESYRLADQVPVADGVADLLQTLRTRGFRLAVATGKAGPRARSLLATLGLIQYFDHVVGSDEVANAKPAPDIVRRALSLLDAEPDAALMVGDAPADIRSARSAGVTAVAATWATVDEDGLMAAGPDLVVHSPGELLPACPPVPAPGRR